MIIHHQILGHHGCHLVLEAYVLLRHLQDHEYQQLLHLLLARLALQLTPLALA